MFNEKIKIFQAMLHNAISDVMNDLDGDDNSMRVATLSMIKKLLRDENGVVSPEKLSAFEAILKERLHERATAEIAFLKSLEPNSDEDDIQTLKHGNKKTRLEAAKFIISVAIMVGASPEKEQHLLSLLTQLELPEDEIQKIRDGALSMKKSQNILRSGAGILTAVIILVFFLLSATLLKPLAFGVMFACLLLPMEKFVEKILSSKNPLVRGVIFIFVLPFWPFIMLKRRIVNRFGSGEKQAGSAEYRKKSRIIGAATAITCITVLLVVAFGAIYLFSATNSFVRKTFKASPEQTTAISADSTDEIANYESQTSAANTDLNDSIYERAKNSDVAKKFSQNFNKFTNEIFENPNIKKMIDWVKNEIQKEEFQQEVTKFLQTHSGGILSGLFSMLRAMSSFAGNLLLTFFFMMFFLHEMAQFFSNDAGKGTLSHYLVQRIFASSWVPETKPESLATTEEIVGEVFRRLKNLLYGYLTLVCIDTTVYMTCFGFMHIPYFPLLAIIAGCGIILPYLGPIASCSLTVIVVLTNGGTGFDVLAVLATYLIYNGLIEQFILYPMVIGGNLGLNTLETIVFVLLGAIFAGIPGMIFALPAASVIKYLVPKIYRLCTLPSFLK